MINEICFYINATVRGGETVCLYDENRWHQEYEETDAHHYMSYEEYKRSREIAEYGQTKEELGIDDDDD